MGYKSYSDGERAEALIKLWASKYDYDSTSIETGISVKTLRRWDKDAPKKDIPDLLTRAIQRMLMVIPTEMSGNTWATALGIMLDKWLLMRGEPTSRTETIEHKLDRLNDAEYSSVIEEAEAIIRRASSG